MIWFSVAIVIFLLSMSFFISALETAIIAASPGRILAKVNEKNSKAKKAKLLSELLNNKDKVISTLLIIYSILNTVATTVATGIIIDIFGEDNGTIIASALMSLLIIVFAEVIPKAIAVSKSVQIAIGGAYFIQYALKIMKPINYFLQKILVGFCFVFRINLKNEVSATDEVRGVIEHYHKEGNVKKGDRDMLGAVLDLRHIKVNEVMVHRSSIITINADLPISDIINKALSTPHTRIPLWKGSKDNIIGILHLRNLLKALHKQNFDYKKIHINDFISEPWYIPENTLLTTQLYEFRTKKKHFAIVVDEYGDILGILTLEDILEEIVGQIDDEHDLSLNNIINKGNNKYIVEGSTTLRDINRELNVDLPDEEAHTIAGLIMYEMERIPNVGESIVISDIKMTIAKRKNHTIKSVLLELQEE